MTNQSRRARRDRRLVKCLSSINDAVTRLREAISRNLPVNSDTKVLLERCSEFSLLLLELSQNQFWPAFPRPRVRKAAPAQRPRRAKTTGMITEAAIECSQQKATK